MKWFICVWDDGHEGVAPGKTKIEAKPETFFTEDNGYDEHDMSLIENLELAECLGLVNLFIYHSVVRVR